MCAPVLCPCESFNTFGIMVFGHKTTTKRPPKRLGGLFRTPMMNEGVRIILL